MENNKPNPIRLFPLGRIVATCGIEEHIQNGDLPDISDYITRHVTGDFGNVDSEDRQTNLLSIETNGMVLSSYTMPETMKKFWIITEGDRSVTTVLLPEEY